MIFFPQIYELFSILQIFHHFFCHVGITFLAVCDHMCFFSHDYFLILARFITFAAKTDRAHE